MKKNFLHARLKSLDIELIKHIGNFNVPDDKLRSTSNISDVKIIGCEKSKQKSNIIELF